MLAHPLGAVLVAAGFVAFFVLHEFTTRKPTRSLHGDARFASRAEIRAAGLYAQRGIVVGRDGKRLLVFGGQEFALVAAPTRSGKGVGIVIPNLLSYPDSVVVLDIKGENYQHTAAFRQSHGQRVHRFAPFSGDSAKYNPLASLSEDADRRFGEVMALAGSLYPAVGDTTFWQEQAANLFVGLVLYLCESPELPRTMNQLLKIAAGSQGVEMRRGMLRLSQARMAGRDPLSPACSGALARFAANSEAAAAGILSSFNAPLLVFADPLVANATESSDFDFADLRRERCSIYVCIEPQHLSAARVLLNLFFTQLIFQNTRSIASGFEKSAVSCLLVMDEFTSIGRLEILAHSIAFIAGYGLRLLTIVQSVAQLTGVYGESATRVLLANHALRVVFAPNELRDAREISELLGTTTVRIKSESESRSSSGRARLSRMLRTTEVPRALLLPQELRDLRKDQEVILLAGTKPIRAEKIRYYEDAAFRRAVQAGNASMLTEKPKPGLSCEANRALRAKSKCE